jgi:hypothetical protein
MWMLADGAAEAAAAPPPEGVRLVPAFDQYVIAAARHAEQLIHGPHRDRVYRAQGQGGPPGRRGRGRAARRVPRRRALPQLGLTHSRTQSAPSEIP